MGFSSEAYPLISVPSTFDSSFHRTSLFKPSLLDKRGQIQSAWHLDCTLDGFLKSF